MDFGISNKKFLVTGGGGGLGGAVCQALSAEGAHVIVSDMKQEAAQAVVDSIGAKGGRAETLQLDLTRYGEFKNEVENLGRIDGLVNICGGPRPGAILEVDTDEWNKYCQSLLIGTFELTRIIAELMKINKWGRIITSTSSGVIVPIDNLGISNTLRGALLGWSKTLANEVAIYGITSNIVIPGRIATKRIEALDLAKSRKTERSIDEVRHESWGAIPTARYGKPEEFADLVTFLCSERASYINGSLFRVDGGYIKAI